MIPAIRWRLSHFLTERITIRLLTHDLVDHIADDDTIASGERPTVSTLTHAAEGVVCNVGGFICFDRDKHTFSGFLSIYTARSESVGYKREGQHTSEPPST